MTAVDRVAWFVFVCLIVPLWVSGVTLFVHSGLRIRKKVLWSVFLVAVGIAIGVLLPLAGIRNRFFLLLALLPALAFSDVKLASSHRTFLFWFRACAFEVCTVFASAALTRLVLSVW